MTGCQQQQQQLYACPLVELAGPPSLAPAPNATGVPTTAGDLVFAGNSPGNNAEVLLIPEGHTGATIVLKPLFVIATPNPMPTFGELSGSFAVAHTTLMSETLYDVQFKFESESDGCPALIGPSGSFTTQ